MDRLITKDGIVKYSNGKDILRIDEKQYEYVIAEVDAKDYESQEMLLGRNYRWHDSVIVADIFLKNTKVIK